MPRRPATRACGWPRSGRRRRPCWRQSPAGRSTSCRPCARAEGLLAELPPRPARACWWPRPTGPGPCSPTGWPRAGHDVEAVVAYRTVERPPSTPRGRLRGSVDAVVLASGSAAAPTPPPSAHGTGARVPVVVAIGPVTAEAARAAGSGRPRRRALDPRRPTLSPPPSSLRNRLSASQPDDPGSSGDRCRRSLGAMAAPFPLARPRRLRRTPALRDLVAETHGAHAAT